MIMRTTISSLACVTSLLVFGALGCGVRADVVTTGSGSSATSGPGGAGGAAPSSTAIAIRHGDIPPPPGSAATGTGGGLDPDTLEIDVSSVLEPCGAGYWSWAGICDSWRVFITIAP